MLTHAPVPMWSFRPGRLARPVPIAPALPFPCARLIALTRALLLPLRGAPVLTQLLALMLAWLVAPLSFAAPTSVGEEFTSYTGRAMSLRSQHFLYGEHHLLAERSGKLTERVVLYTCRDGTPFGRKTVSYVDALAPNFDLDDASNGMREGIRSTDGHRTVFFREGSHDAEKTAPLPAVPNLVADAGFDQFVHDNWNTLTTEHSMSIRFLVPSRLDDIGFRIDTLRKDQMNGTPVQVLRLKLAGLFGWFLPGIDVYYGVDDHVLRRYVGLSDLRDTSGNNLTVDVTFDPRDRKPATRADLDAALQARLAPCK